VVGFSCDRFDRLFNLLIDSISFRLNWLFAGFEIICRNVV
jgi:hypothetical protein